MSYYSNSFYPNYQYASQYTQQPIISSLHGKIVDNMDIVKVTEVPFGGFAIFPKGDMSEIYIKNWNNNGTTQIITYKPIVQEGEEQISNPINSIDLVLQRIDSLENKIDNIINGKKPVVIKDKEVGANATK